MSQLHEERTSLSRKTLDSHRAISSLMEELEAVDWYQQRIDACTDDRLCSILAHNRDEEVEHAVMTLEWMRCNSQTWDLMLRKYLFVDGDLDSVDSPRTHPPTSASGDLGVAQAIAAEESKEQGDR